MKHKIFALMLIILVLCLAACGSKDAAAPVPGPTAQPTDGNNAPYQDPENTIVELPTAEEPTVPEIEFGWEPAAPSGSFDTTESATEEPAPEQNGGTNGGNNDESPESDAETDDDVTEEETSPAERDGVTGNYTPWG